MTINEILDMIGRGDIGVLGLIAFFLWKMERALTMFLTEVRTERKAREEKIDALHDDVSGVIRHIAGINGQGKQGNMRQ